MTDNQRKPQKGAVPAPGKDDSALDPFEIEFRPEFHANRGPHEPFVNSHGVVIGDHDYESPQSPLENWSAKTDPAVMAGDEWVHPYKDIGFRTSENRDLFENGIAPRTGTFGHPTHQTAYAGRSGGRSPEDEEEEDAYYSVPEVLDEP
ncbi:DUF3905 domain-containing protein [Cohnella zeiphila]|uniref:DUF3905 domain-containing protein n=1 Tax=Cohnella zeiphila TaxID=2761120 RepID=A0A7X0SI01_9BACL|nr:DUF3905 domain-containing protein [Cohnella zeiphila]MBB6730226.1 DUF3905 domain-containing protein [Cohnella zeiphila]